MPALQLTNLHKSYGDHTVLRGIDLSVKDGEFVAILGFSGTGKTTLARALADGVGGAAGARLVRSDVVRKPLAGVAPETRLAA